MILSICFVTTGLSFVSMCLCMLMIATLEEHDDLIRKLAYLDIVLAGVVVMSLLSNFVIIGMIAKLGVIIIGAIFSLYLILL